MIDLRAVRQAAGLTQPEQARRMGFSARSGMVQIYHYEHSAKLTASGWRKVCAYENKVVVCREVRR